MTTPRLLEVAISLIYHSPVVRSENATFLVIPSSWLNGHPTYAPSLDNYLRACGYSVKKGFSKMPPEYRVSVLARLLFLLESFVADVLCLVSTASGYLNSDQEDKGGTLASLAYLLSEYLGTTSTGLFDPLEVQSDYFIFSIERRLCSWLLEDEQLAEIVSVRKLISQIIAGAMLNAGDQMVGFRYQGISRREVPGILSKGFSSLKESLFPLYECLSSLLVGLNSTIDSSHAVLGLNGFAVDEAIFRLYQHVCAALDALSPPRKSIRYMVQQNSQNHGWRTVYEMGENPWHLSDSKKAQLPVRLSRQLIAQACPNNFRVVRLPST